MKTTWIGFHSWLRYIKNRIIICINKKVSNKGWGDKLRKAITSFFIAFLLLVSLLEVAGAAAQPSQKIPVIVGFKDKSDADLIGKHGGDVKYQYSTISAIACSLPQGAIDALERNPRIAYIEFDGKVQMTQEEPPFSSMYPPPFDSVDRIDAELVHSYNKGTGVKVAIIDTGIDPDHPDLDDNCKGGFDFVNDDTTPMDDNGHGTHVAGIVAAKDDSLGVIGVAPQAWLYAVKVLDAAGSGDVSDVIAGIQWAITNGMDIISMSLRSTVDNQALHDICDTAYNDGNGILVVAAAGNDYSMRGRRKELDTVGYPARYDSVIAVGATDNTDTRASYSSTGSALELTAPGDYINSTMLDNTYALGSGTSMACPHVTGTAALILSSDSELSASEVRNRLQNTADDLGSPGWDSWYGYGLVDANRDAPGAPTISKLTPAVGAFINDETPTISAIVTDADGVASRQMMLDGGEVDTTYDVGTGPVSHVVPSDPSLVDGRHTVTLTVSDGSNEDVTSWSFTVDTEAPDPVTGVTVDTISSSSLFISWDASTDPHLVTYDVYRKAPGETEYTLHVGVCTYSEGDPPRAGFFPDTGLEPDAIYWYKISAVDMAGNEGEQSTSVSGTTTPAPAKGEMHIDRILLDWRYGRITRKNTVVFAEALVVIVDAGGVPVPGATVSGHWEDATTDSDSGVTDDMGIARLRSDSIRNPPIGTTFTFEVDTVVKEGWDYVWSANGDFNDDGVFDDTSNSITYP
jgi:subtilisin